MQATWLAHSTFGTIASHIWSLNNWIADYVLVALVIPKGGLAGPRNLNWQIMFRFMGSCCFTCGA